MARSFRWLVRFAGLVLALGALYSFWEALRSLDRREYVSAALAVCVGWLVLTAGVEFIRPDTAE